MSNILHLWGIFLGTVIGLLPIINPAAAAITFVTITEGDSEERRREQARKGCFYMIGILVSFLVGGTFIMNFFGISIPGLRIAGGIMVTSIGMGMLGSTTQDAKTDNAAQEAARKKVDISFSPLAMPILSGPGSIAVTLGFTSLATNWFDYVALIAGILVVAVITYLALRVSGRIVHLVGPVGLNAMNRIMGFLIMCIGVQFVVNGVLGVATDPDLLRNVQAVLGGHR